MMHRPSNNSRCLSGMCVLRTTWLGRESRKPHPELWELSARRPGSLVFDVCCINWPGATAATAIATDLFSWVGVGWLRTPTSTRLFTLPILSCLLGEASIRSRKESLADSFSELCCGWPGPLPMGPCFPGLENKMFWGWMFEAGLRQGPCANLKTVEVIPGNGTLPSDPGV